MVTAYVSGEIVINNHHSNKKSILEFSKFFDGVFNAMIAIDSGPNVISFFCTSENEDLNIAREMAERKFNKIYEFLKVAVPYKIQIRTGLKQGFYNLSDTEITYEKFGNLRNNISDEEFEKYLVDPNNLDSRLLLEAINDYDDEKYLDAFSKLVNYSDDMPNVKKFCSLRDSVLHREVDRARPKVQKLFPNEFEYVGDSFVRDSPKNIMNLKKYWPIVLKEARTKFFSMVKNS